MRKVATASIWICEPSRSNHVFHVVGEVGYLEEATIEDPYDGLQP